MTSNILSSGLLDPVGSDARRPVLIAFLLFIAVSLLWLFTLAATEDDNPEKLYIADRSLSPVFNGFAMAGEQISVVTLLTISGAVSLFGYDGFTFALDILITLGVLLLLAQKIRNSGRYTLGDLFSLRASGPGPRIAATVMTLAIGIPVLMIQLRAAGISTALLVGMSSDESQVLCTVLMGCVVACFATVANLRETSFMHVVKVPITLTVLAVVTLLALKKFEWSPGALLSAAADKSMSRDDYLSPGLYPHTANFGLLNTFGTHVVFILGTAVMPHLILRISASRTGRAARRSMSIATGLVGVFVLLLISAGFASAAVVGAVDIGAVDASGQSALIQLASGVVRDGSTGQVVLITVMACVVFFAVLTAVTSATFAAAVSLAHDVFAQGSRRRSNTAEVRALRVAAIVVGAVSLSLAAAIHRYPPEFLATFSMSVAASCIFPVLIYSFFWRRFNRKGLLWSTYGGLLLCTILTVFSPTVSGTSFALWPEGDFDWYPFQTPGLVSVPAAFLLGWLGSVIRPADSEVDFRHVEYRILTGMEVSQASDPKW
ncbi:sodium/solute symporter [Streptomyces mirabilis]|jgi:cation/acetate symporter|uniref:Cation/acetate symporter n=1 Tax=Streptomyces mirabilis TaxID=68239 RepID=A0A1I2XKM7_9ACTN|nr:cation acetate symporter [Streptomyces mirabilis]SFH13637.1 cation/acetate symporter [Streptomyces mirabilis]